MKTFVICWGISILMLVLLMIRNSFTCKKQLEANNIIFKYLINLGRGNYDFSRDCYAEMKIEYNKYMWSFWMWGLPIKKQYKELLKPYIDQNK